MHGLDERDVSLELYPQGYGQAGEALFPTYAEYSVSGKAYFDISDGAEYGAGARSG